jgi:spermidine/putrescine transport system permease protein
MAPAHHRSLGAGVITALAIAFLVLPVIIIVLFSFQDSGSLAFPLDKLSFRWYRAVFTESDVGEALRFSLTIAGIVAALTLVFGTLAAYGTVRAPRRLQPVLTLLFFLPIALPGLFVGVGLLIWFLKIRLSLGMGSIVIAHVVYAFPFFFLIARVALERLDPALEEAAATLGAGPLYRFRRVTLPQVFPLLLAAAALAFMLSIDEFIITNLVVGDRPTLPILISTRLRRTVDPQLNVISTLLITASVLAWMLAFAAIVRRDRQRARRLQLLDGTT